LAYWLLTSGEILAFSQLTEDSMTCSNLGASLLNWDSDGLLMIDYLPSQKTITGPYYAQAGATE